MNQYFARVTFTGKDVDLAPEEIPGVSEEDLEYELVEFVDMTDEKAVKSFTGEDAAIDFITENGESFARVTALGDLPYIWSKSYPMFTTEPKMPLISSILSALASTHDTYISNTPVRILVALVPRMSL